MPFIFKGDRERNNRLTPVIVAAAVALLLRVVVVLAEEGVVGHDVQAISRVQLQEEFKS